MTAENNLHTCFFSGFRLAHIFPMSLDLSARLISGCSSFTLGLISALKNIYAVAGLLGAFGSLASVRLRFTPVVVGVVVSSATSEVSNCGSSLGSAGENPMVMIQWTVLYWSTLGRVRWDVLTGIHFTRHLSISSRKSTPLPQSSSNRARKIISRMISRREYHCIGGVSKQWCKVAKMGACESMFWLLAALATLHVIRGQCTQSSCTEQCFPSKLLSMNGGVFQLWAPPLFFQTCGKEICVTFIFKYHHGERRQSSVGLAYPLLRSDQHYYRHRCNGTRLRPTGSKWDRHGSRQLWQMECQVLEYLWSYFVFVNTVHNMFHM